jgi:hypothetical protein
MPKGAGKESEEKGMVLLEREGLRTMPEKERERESKNAKGEGNEPETKHWIPGRVMMISERQNKMWYDTRESKREQGYYR